MRFYILAIFLSFSGLVVSQNLQPIPDENLRNELKKQGFVENESLYIPKTKGRLQLEIDGKGIENLDGLQYFQQVWKLTIRNNKIKSLDYLPPNLTVLDCSNNEITAFKNIPQNLDWLSINNNKLTELGPLPASLTGLSCSNNLLYHLPNLPSNLKWINFSNNPINLDSLPENYKKISCAQLWQNCLPYELRNWKILNSNITDTSWKIVGMQVIQSSRYSWGNGTELQTTDFKLKNGKLIASKTQIVRIKGESNATRKIKTKYSFNLSDLISILQDIFHQKMIFEFNLNDTLKVVNLADKKDGQTSFSSCEDCSGFGFMFKIYTKTDTLILNHGFEMEPSLQKVQDLVDIKPVLDWFYLHKLCSMTIPKNEIVRYYFNDKVLNGLINRLN